MFNSFEIKQMDNAAIYRDFLFKWHYIKSMPRGCSKVFGLYINGLLSGVACYGHPVGCNVIKTHGVGTLELKRFCLVADMPKNSCSWFMAKCYALLKRQGHTKIISYADPEQGHEGTIYKAANFKYFGKQVQGTAYYLIKGKKVYRRNVYQHEKYVPVRKQIDKGTIKQKRRLPKHIYVYP